MQRSSAFIRYSSLRFRTCVERGAAAEKAWQEKVFAYTKAFPDLAKQWRYALNGVLPDGWDASLPEFSAAPAIAAQEASGEVLNAIAKKVQALISGSAELGALPKNSAGIPRHDFAPGRARTTCG